MAVAAESSLLLRRNIFPLPEDDDGQERPLHQRKIGSYFIVAAELFERLTCYSISGMVLVFLTNPPLCFSPSSALAMQFMFIATMYMFCLVAGVVSDSYISRHTTIILGYFIYIIGYSIWVVATFTITRNIDPHNLTKATECDKCRDSTISDQEYNKMVMLVIVALFTISVGAAIVRANLAVFGAQQVSYLLKLLI
ncbi:SLC15A4 [Bugula neritina]|uniref:SLC15A4 n=1 Tax=Bugula neritina TaxID=10212 RepID=A0A7J7IUK4_BUGNE|nr:SLC15A4 [Bugula neritina]